MEHVIAGKYRRAAMVAGPVLVGLALLAAPAYADGAFPLTIAVIPWAWMLIPAMVAIETFVVSMVSRRGLWTGLKVAVAANFASIVVGAAATWVLMVVSETLPAFVAWGPRNPFQRLLGGAGASQWLAQFRHWELVIVVILAFLPMFFLSVGCKYCVASRFFSDSERLSVGRWAWAANTASYVFLAACVSVAVIRRC